MLVYGILPYFSYCALYGILFAKETCYISYITCIIHLLPVVIYSVTNIDVVIYHESLWIFEKYAE